MATTYQLKTFADLYNAVREELKIQSTDTTSIQRIQRDMNIVYLDEVVPFSNWRWLRGNLNVNVQAAFVSGTAAVVQNNASVTLTIAPASSRARYYFSVVGYNEIYRIQSHAANSTTVVLEAPYTGSTNATAAFKIWTDEIPLPSMVRETTTITHDFQDIPLENCGLQKFRSYVAALPKAEGRPQFYTCESYSDPGYFITNAALPAISTRASSTLTKTLVFASDVSSYLPQGTRFRVQTAGDSTYNGEYVVATQSTTTITYTGIYPLEESATADATISVQIAVSASNDRRYKRLLIYPSINSSNQMLHVDYLREVPPLVNDTDEPLMPIGDRVVLLYGALQRAWARERNPEEAARNQKMYEMKLARMAGKVDDSIEPPRLQINRIYLGAKRANTRQRSTMYGSIEGWGGGGGGSSSSVPQNTANRVAVFDATGTLNADTLVSVAELERLDGIGSSVVGVSDTQTLTNKTINATSNTISNIANSNVAAGAGIVYSKLNLTGGIVNADVASGAAIAYSKLNLTGSVTNADLAGSIAASKLVGSDIATVGTITTGTWSAATIAINKGGTGQTTASAAFDALAPNTTKGDIAVRGSSSNVRLAIGSDNQVLTADSAQTNGVKWATPATVLDASNDYVNGSIAASVSANALTVALKDKSGSTPSAGSPVQIGFRSATSTTGTYVVRSVTGALSVVAPDATSLGLTIGVATYLYVYAIDNAGTVELALSASIFGEGSIQNTAAISGGSNSGSLYSTSARTGVAVRLIGRIAITLGASTHWSGSPTEISNPPFKVQAPFLRYGVATGTMTGTPSKVTYTTLVEDNRNTYSSGTYTTREAGVYHIDAGIRIDGTFTAGQASTLAVYVNGVLTGLAALDKAGAAQGSLCPHVHQSLRLAVGDTVEIYGDCNGSSLSVSADGNYGHLTIVKVAD